jgi:hypothetical protein
MLGTATSAASSASREPDFGKRPRPLLPPQEEASMPAMTAVAVRTGSSTLGCRNRRATRHARSSSVAQIVHLGGELDLPAGFGFDGLHAEDWLL